jgi:MFS family permease
MYLSDLPGAIKEALLAEFRGFNTTLEPEYVFNLMISIYSFPNIILPFFGGILVDKIGHRLVAVSCSGLIVISQICIVAGLHYKSTLIMLGGQFVFGVGGETLLLTVMTILNHWFHGAELSFAQAFSISVQRTATIINFNFSPWLYNQVKSPGHPRNWVVSLVNGPFRRWTGLLLHLICICSLFGCCGLHIRARTA